MLPKSFYDFNNKEISWVTQMSQHRAGLGVILIQWLRNVTKDQFFHHLCAWPSLVPALLLIIRGLRTVLWASCFFDPVESKERSCPPSLHNTVPALLWSHMLIGLALLSFNPSGHRARLNWFALWDPTRKWGRSNPAQKAREDGADAGGAMQVRTNEH